MRTPSPWRLIVLALLVLALVLPAQDFSASAAKSSSQKSSKNKEPKEKKEKESNKEQPPPQPEPEPQQPQPPILLPPPQPPLSSASGAHQPQNQQAHGGHHGMGGMMGGSSRSDNNKGIPKQILENWASNFGGQLFQFGVSVTKYNELQSRFSTAPGADVHQINLATMIVDMVEVINKNLKEKIEAIRKIMNWAEEKALEFYDRPPDSRPKPPDTYYNSKKLNGDGTKEELYHNVEMNYDQHFDNLVNTSFSSVHVPTSIYEKKEDVLESIGWSSNMDETFVSNYNLNPTLSYQYFGSATGFLRHYPSMQWPNNNSDRQNPDLYDCRTRPWYVQAANTPKNMFILHDVSGSMTGIRREIAKHVVNTLLDTLTENDYVNVYNFSDVTTPVVNCFRNRLVQANLENIRELKVGLEQDHTAGIANFTSALNTAFDILDKARNEQDSSDCNQAIMIITDGAPFYFDELFKSRQNPEHFVRVFTYLIGREVTEKREVLWMACANRGYFAHVSTLSEVQEKVLKYMPVMSRPMVITKRHEEAWSPVYAHIADTRETDWSWLDHNTRMQFRRSNRYKALLRMLNERNSTLFKNLESDEYDDGETRRHQEIELRRRIEEFLGMQAQKEIYFPTPAKPKDPTEPFDFIISASIPVFDNRNSTIIYETVRVNASYSYENPIEERIAIFLGVAGTDIPIRELKKMASPFQLGVNGYAFMVNNNGYLIFHPDWRPVFNGELLKPNYNTVDMSEVELVDRDDNFRNNDSKLLEMRTDMIEEERAYRKGLRVRVHQDNFEGDAGTEGGGEVVIEEEEVEIIEAGDEPVVVNMFAVDDVVKEAEESFVPYYKIRVRKVQDHFRRVTIRNQVYEFHKLRNTPYTLAIAVPENAHRFTGQMEIRIHQENILSYFDRPNELRKWKVNPDWSYCDFVRGGEKHRFDSKEDQLLYFLKNIQNKQNSWAWRNTGVGVKHRHQGHQGGGGGGGGESRWHTSEGQEVYDCERDLVQSLVFDANVTQIFNDVNLWRFNKNDKPLLQMNGVTRAFIATRTGLTRWMDFSTSTGGSSGAGADSGPGVVPGTSDDTLRFVDANSGATNELWYRRAVERYEHDPDSFVYTVPFDAGTRNNSQVTATRAIFVKMHGKQAPVAVVGVQFSHFKWASRFFEITSTGFDTRSSAGETKKTCESGEYDCFVLDDNGFILVSEKHEDTGKFFGEVDGMVMEMLVNSDVYKRVRVVDYQAVCYQPVAKTNFASVLSTPIAHLSSLFNWLLAQFAWMFLQLNFHSLYNPDFSSVLASLSSEDPPHQLEENIGDTLPPYIELASINKTRLRPCDKETFLYTYGSSYNTHNFSYHGLLTKCGHSGCDGYFNVHYIPHTNLILVVTDGKCRCGLNSTTIRQQEVQYKKSFSGKKSPPPSQKQPQHNNMDDDEGEDELDILFSSSPKEVCRTPKPILHRKRPPVCINYNAQEEYIREDCGGGPASSSANVFLVAVSLALTCRLSQLHHQQSSSVVAVVLVAALSSLFLSSTSQIFHGTGAGDVVAGL